VPNIIHSAAKKVKVLVAYGGHLFIIILFLKIGNLFFKSKYHSKQETSEEEKCRGAKQKITLMELH
jgi:hypothetical protein